MERQYFGTDGIRGKVGQSPINPEFCLRLGWAVGKVFARKGSAHILIGKDTRISGYMLESVLESGLASAGVDVSLIGPMPTPAIAYLTRTLRADAGIVISASHNPYFDNGIKFFDGAGNKLPDAVELEIEAQLQQPMICVESDQLGKAARVADAAGRYIEFCKATVPRGFSLRGFKIALDCAHGATYHVAPRVFEELGADVTAMGIAPDGTNINAGCGSTQPQALRELVAQSGSDLGIAFDGDGDRVCMVDRHGNLLDGDQILYIIASHRQQANTLGGGVVGTVMSNFGLQRGLQDLGIEFQRASVGDRYVLEKLREQGWYLGGETSGHVLCLDLVTTGDAIVAALQALLACVETGQTLDQMAGRMRKLPQLLVNVEVPNPKETAGCAKMTAAVAAKERQLNGRGRVLVRPSGTEPLLRIMVEGEDADEVSSIAGELAEFAQHHV